MLGADALPTLRCLRYPRSALLPLSTRSLRGGMPLCTRHVPSHPWGEGKGAGVGVAEAGQEERGGETLGESGQYQYWSLGVCLGVCPPFAFPPCRAFSSPCAVPVV